MDLDRDILSKNIIAIITALIVAAITAAVTFTYKTSTEIALVNLHIKQLSAQIEKVDSRIESIQRNYATRDSVVDLDARVRNIEQKLKIKPERFDPVTSK